MSGEQHQQWREISRRVWAAKQDHDPHALATAEQERRAFTERMGPYRMEALHEERHQERARQAADIRARKQAENQERIQRLRWAQEWQARPHSRLTDTALDRARRDAEQRAAREQAAADKARGELAAREPDVTAGRGPRVTELDTRVHQLRVNAERQATVEALQQRWHQVVERAGDAAEQATRKEHDAERTSWWQPGKRDQLNAEAAALREAAEKASKEAGELATHAAEIQRQLGGPRMWQQARDFAEHAEATYDRDREQAITADRRDLTRLERAAETHDTNALQAATRHTELTAERDLRDTMPQPQQAVENQLRVEQQQLDRATALQQRVTALKQDLALDPHEVGKLEVEQGHHPGHERTQLHEVHQQMHDRDIDRGPGLGL